MQAYKKGDAKIKKLIIDFLKFHKKYQPELINEFKK